MNILSETEYDYERYGNRPSCRNHDHDCERYDNRPDCRNYDRAPEPGRAILACGSGGAGPLPMISTQLSRPIPVASVSIDTTNMCNPKILLTFTALIVLPATIMVNLNFIIVKTTDGGAPQEIGGTHTFSEVASVLESESFGFQFCDCTPCHSCTTYTVKIEPSSLIAETAGLTITNATLCALAVESL